MSSDFREQFINHMTLQRFSPHTQKNYTLAMKGFCRFFNQPPDALSQEHVQKYLLYLVNERKLSWGAVNNIIAGISCFYKNVLKWDETKFKLPPRPRVKKLPCVLSEEEVKRLFEGAANLKHKVFLKTVYSSGIRISEAICLRPEHIESDLSRMMIRIEQGKGKKDRYTILSKCLLPELREYWRKYQPGEWLFFGSNRKKHIGSTGANAIFQRAKKAGITRGRGLHSLRHYAEFRIMPSYILKPGLCLAFRRI